MGITLKDLDVQPSFPEMNGSSYAADTRANDADSLDVEMLIAHGPEHYLVGCTLYRCDRESSNKRECARVIQKSQRDQCWQSNECDGNAI